MRCASAKPRRSARHPPYETNAPCQALLFCLYALFSWDLTNPTDCLHVPGLARPSNRVVPSPPPPASTTAPGEISQHFARFKTYRISARLPSQPVPRKRRPSGKRSARSGGRGRASLRRRRVEEHPALPLSPLMMGRLRCRSRSEMQGSKRGAFCSPEGADADAAAEGAVTYDISPVHCLFLPAPATPAAASLFPPRRSSFALPAYPASKTIEWVALKR